MMIGLFVILLILDIVVIVFELFRLLDYKGLLFWICRVIILLDVNGVIMIFLRIVGLGDVIRCVDLMMF